MRCVSKDNGPAGASRPFILRDSPCGANAPHLSHLRMTVLAVHGRLYSAAAAFGFTRYCAAGWVASSRARPAPNNFSRSVPPA